VFKFKYYVLEERVVIMI